MINPRALRAGQLDKIGQLQVSSTTADAVGATQKTWATTWTGWVGVIAIGMLQQWQTSQFTSKTTHVITMNYLPTVAVQAGMRFVIGAHTFLIDAVDDIMLWGSQLRIQCIEINGVE